MANVWFKGLIFRTRIRVGLITKKSPEGFEDGGEDVQLLLFTVVRVTRNGVWFTPVLESSFFDSVVVP